jgi:hypothetical protein
MGGNHDLSTQDNQGDPWAKLACESLPFVITVTVFTAIGMGRSSNATVVQSSFWS